MRPYRTGTRTSAAAGVGHPSPLVSVKMKDRLTLGGRSTLGPDDLG